MTDDLVGRLRKLLEAARLGELVACGGGDGSTQMGMTNIFDADAEALIMECVPEKDAELIVEAVNALPTLLARIEALEAENRKLREAIKPFADCADELDGSEWTPRAPDGEWAKFRLLTDDYRAARAALTPEPPHAD